MRKSLVSLVSWVMILAVPAATMAAETPAATLRANGPVTLNGAPSREFGPVFSGDTVATGEGAQAVLTATNSMVLMPANSVLTLGAERVKVRSGAAVVTTSRRLGAQLGGVTVTPESVETTRFVLAEKGRKIEVAALKGTVFVSDGTTTTPLGEGSAVSLDPAAQPPQAGSSVPVSHALGGPELGIILAVAAAVAAGVILGVVNTREASPSVP